MDLNSRQALHHLTLCKRELSHQLTAPAELAVLTMRISTLKTTAPEMTKSQVGTILHSTIFLVKMSVGCGCDLVEETKGSCRVSLCVTERFFQNRVFCCDKQHEYLSDFPANNISNFAIVTTNHAMAYIYNKYKSLLYQPAGSCLFWCSK